MRTLLPTVFILSSLSLFSQALNFDTVTVSANRIPQKIYETGRDVIVLDRSTIQSIPAQSPDEVLRYIPGMEVQSRGAFGVQSDLSIRGATFSQVLVLIDGIRLNDPLTAHFNGYIPLSMEEVKRIEIIKGPAAALYGADAMGGVINFITYTGDADFGEAPLDGSASAKIGDHDLSAAETGVRIASDNVEGSLGLGFRESEGHPLPTGGRGFFDMKTASGGLAVKKGKWQLYARSAYDDRHFSAKNFYTLSPIDSSVETIKNSWNMLRASRIGAKDRTDASINYRNTRDVFAFIPGVSTNTHTTQQWIAQIDHKHIVNDQLQWKTGVQGTRRTIESTDRGDHETNHLGAYGMSQWRPAEDWSLNGSLRMDADENYGVEFTPQVSVAYLMNQWVLRASAGRSIRAADFTERYISTNIPAPLSSGRNLGKPELNAERAWTAETGVEWSPSPVPSLSLSASGYYRKASDVIDYILTPASDIETADNLNPDGAYLYAGNIAEVTTVGIDSRIGYSRSFGNSSLKGSFGLLIQDIQTDEPVNSKYITNQADVLFTANAMWNNPYFNLAVSGLYKQRPSRMAEALGVDLSSSYTVWNVEWGVHLAGNRVQVTGSVMNLFDEQYSDKLGAQMPGRWFMGGLRFDL